MELLPSVRSHEHNRNANIRFFSNATNAAWKYFILINENIDISICFFLLS